MKIVWYKHNLMISSSVGYDHPVKYSYEIPHEHLSGSGNDNFLSRICCDFFRQLYYCKSYFFTLFQSNIFQSNTQVTFSEQLFLQRSCFFEELLFQNSHFFSAFFSSEQLLFQSETSTEQPHLENRKFFSAVTFRNSYLEKKTTEALLFRSRFFSTTSFFSEKLDFGKGYFLRKTIFQRAAFVWRAAFLIPFS